VHILFVSSRLGPNHNPAAVIPVRKLHFEIEGDVMRKVHIEIGNEEALEGVAKTRMHKRSTEKKKRKKAAKKASGRG
jgi:hypothetical protein